MTRQGRLHILPTTAGWLLRCGGPALCPACVHEHYAPLVAAARILAQQWDQSMRVTVRELDTLRRVVQDLASEEGPHA